MTYKGFLKWTNDRACDGRWGLDVAMVCTQMATLLYSVPWFRRKKLWQEMQGDEFIEQIVIPTSIKYQITDSYR